MEVAGLAVGAVTLVSLFKDCIDLFSMITAARHLGKDAAILDTKLDVERMLFLQWSERVGLLEQGSTDNLFGNKDTQNIVLSVLESIKGLLSEGDALQKDYGLKRFNDTILPHPDSPPTRHQGASSFRLARFVEKFEALKIQSCEKSNSDGPCKRNTAAKRIRWVIVDKDKFNNLINHLSYFNSSLNELVPTDRKSTLISSEKDLAKINNVEQLDLIIKASEQTRPNVKRAALAAKSAIRILRCLWFRWYDARRTTVKSPHFKTLQWALNPPKDYLKWDDLSIWLQSSSGIYWLSGKAGSGKSTLMKYLHGHKRTHALLNTWASGSELISANFFFYALGKTDQKSHSGLLRSLLYQILDQDPSGMDTVLPHMWREACYKNEEGSPSLTIPTVPEMASALKDLCSTVHADKKLFFLIDGIDEYEGKDLDIAEFTSELGSFPNVKVLVSSRPHSAFTTAFRSKPKMHLHDLTKDDVASYVDDIVASHPYMVTVSQIAPMEVEKSLKDL